MLIAVLDEPGMTVAEISRSIPEAQQPISSARLEKLGLIERRHGPGRNKPRPRTTWPSQGRLEIEVLDINDSAQIARYATTSPLEALHTRAVICGARHRANRRRPGCGAGERAARCGIQRPPRL
jgi:hypothetical protein